MRPRDRRDLLFAWLGACLVCFGMLAIPAATRAAIPGIDGNPSLLAFDSDRSGHSEIYVIQGDGGGLQRIPADGHRGSDSHPAWAPPDAFTDETDLGICDSGGTATPGAQITLCGNGFDLLETHVLFPSPSGAISVSPSTVSADGTMLTVAVPEAATTGDICATKPSNAPLLDGLPIATSGIGEGLVSLTVTDADGQPRPAVVDALWCNQPLAFQSNRSGRSDIWLWDPAAPVGARNPVDLTAATNGRNADPSWSPAGGHTPISVYPPDAPNRPLLAFVHSSHGQHAIEVLDPARPIERDGVNPSRLTPQHVDDNHPDWSPDASALAFDSNEGGQREIWVMRVASDPASRRYVAEDRRSLTPGQIPGSEPSWFDFTLSANPTSAIAFTGPLTDAGPARLDYLSWPGSSPAYPRASDVNTFTLAQPGYANHGAAWSPSGGILAYVSTRHGHAQLWLMNNSSTDATHRLLSDRFNDRDPSWRTVAWNAQVSQFQVNGYPNRRRCHRGRCRRH